jgi:hypothetical protein
MFWKENSIEANCARKVSFRRPMESKVRATLSEFSAAPSPLVAPALAAPSSEP